MCRAQGVGNSLRGSHCTPFSTCCRKCSRDFSHMADINIFAVHPPDLHKVRNIRSDWAKGSFNEEIVQSRQGGQCGSPAAPPEGARELWNISKLRSHSLLWLLWVNHFSTGSCSFSVNVKHRNIVFLYGITGLKLHFTEKQ